MSLPQRIGRFTPREYYDLEHEAEYKSDYCDGEIFAMAGGTSRHSLIAMNICGELRQRLKGKPCVPYESNLRLKVKATGLRTYLDASVYCGPLERDLEDPYVGGNGSDGSRRAAKRRRKDSSFLSPLRHCAFA